MRPLLSPVKNGWGDSLSASNHPWCAKVGAPRVLRI